jgi:hypothetical protein
VGVKGHRRVRAPSGRVPAPAAVGRQLAADEQRAVSRFGERPALFAGEVVHGGEETFAFRHPGRILEIAAHILIGVDGHGRHVGAGRKFEDRVRADGPKPRVLTLHGDAFHADGRGLIEPQRHVRRAETMDQPIAQRSAGGEILERAPVAVDQRVESARRRRAEPEIPIERIGHGLRFRAGIRQVGLAAINAAGEGVHFAHLADIARPEDLAGRFQRLVAEALVAHLGRDLIFGRGFGQQVRFVRGARERLLAVDVLAVLHASSATGACR